MGLKQAALNAWHEITEQLQQHRMYVYDKFSRRLRHRYLLRPFNTLQELWNRGRSACSIQTLVRRRQAIKFVEERRSMVVRKEELRGEQERASIQEAEDLMLNRVKKLLAGKKVESRCFYQPCNQETSQHSGAARRQFFSSFAAVATPLFMPRSRSNWSHARLPRSSNWSRFGLSRDYHTAGHGEASWQ